MSVNQLSENERTQSDLSDASVNHLMQKEESPEQDVALLLNLFRQWSKQLQSVGRLNEDALSLKASAETSQTPASKRSLPMKSDESVTLRSGRLARSTSSQGISVPTPGTAPSVSVLTPGGCQHVIVFAHSGPRGSRPAGSSGAEIYIAVGKKRPESLTAFRFAAWATRSPHTLSFANEDAGRTAHYLLRWINAKGECGPWSEMVSAVIPQAIEVAS